MTLKTFFRNFCKDQYRNRFFEDRSLNKKIGDAYYKRILKNPITVYFLGLFTPEIKQLIITLFK